MSFYVSKFRIFLVICTQNLYRVPVVQKCWQCCCCLFICTPPVFLLYRGFAESDQIWRGVIGLIWKIDSLSSSATSRAREVFVIRKYFFLLFFYFHLFGLHFLFRLWGGLTIKLIDIYCGYFLVSSLSLTEEKSAINFSWRRLKLAKSITTNKTIFYFLINIPEMFSMGFAI